ncbi:peptidase M28 [Ramlibacter tataouinensis]|uniref:Peptidase M28 n=2 Tax=Ramlibacter tataouinensis TaxID=94132 RepID=A0A127K012_9BURK|nr:peptidase M28 [Ramlibacter tataouinensis]
MHALVRELYPFCRSITGDGVRATLARIAQEIPLTVHEVPSGTPVFDWTVPREWNIRDAWVKNAAGERVIDFRRHNLHVVSYSVPVHERMSLAELRPHLHSLPAQPDLIPYRTSYYKEAWGFCLPHSTLERLPEGEYEVCIDSTLEDGHLSYGECLLEGDTADEVLVSCHVCHPSLANDNMSGVSVATFLAKALAGSRRRYSYRFLFIPGTIGSITWLSRNEDRARAIRHGLVLTCVGDRAGFTYKKSRRGDAQIDRAIAHVLEHAGRPHATLDFSPYGYDERQYCSPGFNLPVGCLMRSQWGQFPEYHTSADNPGFVDAGSLAEARETVLSVFDVLEHDLRYLNLKPQCEPQLGKRGLYGAMGGSGVRQIEMAMLWVLNLSDGSCGLLDIAERSGLPFGAIHAAAQMLREHDLLALAPGTP